MTKSTEEFSGYIDIGKDRFAYFVSKNWVTLQPAIQDKSEQLAAFERLRHYHNDSSEFFYGTDNVGKVALFRNSNIQIGFSYNSNNGIIESSGFGTPLIIKSKSYNPDITDWTYFDAIKFIGGNINSLHPPMQAIKNITVRRNDSHNQDISFCDDSEYSLKLPVVNDDGSELFIFSVSIETSIDTAPSTRNFDCSSLGNINSYIRLSFNRRKKFNDIEKYFTLIKNLVSLLFGMSNVKFDVCLEQKNSCDEFVESAVCLFADDYKNYSLKRWIRVIPLNATSSILPNLINSIFRKESDVLISLLPDDNRKVNYISIHHVQDMCTALEKSYEWLHEKVKTQRDNYLIGLRKAINQTIKNYDCEYTDFKAYDLTTVSSSFQYLDLTATTKVISLYEENICLFNQIYKRTVHPKNFNETISDAAVIDLIKKFVKLRNAKTHTADCSWNGSECLYDPLLSIVYYSYFMHVGADAEVAEKLSKRLLLF